MPHVLVVVGTFVIPANAGDPKSLFSTSCQFVLDSNFRRNDDWVSELC